MVKEDTVPREVTATAWVNDVLAKVLLNVCAYSQSMTCCQRPLGRFPILCLFLIGAV